MHARWLFAISVLAGVGVAACGMLFPLDEFREHGSSDASTTTNVPFDAANAADSAASASGYARAVLDDHPVLYMRFGERSGSVARDEIHQRDGSYAKTVKLGVPGLIDGDPDTAVAFDGTAGTNVTIPPGLDFAGKARFSVEVWALPTGSAAFMWAVDHQTYGPGRHGWGLDFAEHNVNIERWNANNITGASSTFPLTQNQLHHVVGTFDGAQAVLYIDGVEAGTDTNAASMDAMPSTWTAGGQNCGGCTGSNFVGVLDELAVYDDALPSERVVAHYRAGTGR